MTLHDLLSVRPPEEQVREASRRARIRALARIELTPRPRMFRFMALACAATAMFLLAIALRTPPAQEPASARPPLRVDMTLTDGTRVVWTFDDSLSL
jgi:hypothetical protein